MAKREISIAVIGAADGTSISTEKDDADQPRRIDKWRPMLLCRHRRNGVTRQAQRAITAPVFWSGASALREVWEQLRLPLTVGKERSEFVEG